MPSRCIWVVDAGISSCTFDFRSSHYLIPSHSLNHALCAATTAGFFLTLTQKELISDEPEEGTESRSLDSPSYESLRRRE